jgi:hypothetical protein
MSFKKTLENLLPNWLLYQYTKYKTAKRVKDWEKAGSPHFTLEDKAYREKGEGMVGIDLPATRDMKNRAIAECRERYPASIFVETGTFLGDMIAEQAPNFERLYSIELNDALWKKAQARFVSQPHITLLCGDSAQVLRDLVPQLTAPAIFWLDGHYSGGITAKGLLHTPIMGELEAIASSTQPHRVLIDDARCFTGEEDYPTIEELQERCTQLFPDYKFSVADDIIRLCPNPVIG